MAVPAARGSKSRLGCPELVPQFVLTLLQPLEIWRLRARPAHLGLQMFNVRGKVFLLLLVLTSAPFGLLK